MCTHKILVMLVLHHAKGDLTYDNKWQNHIRYSKSRRDHVYQGGSLRIGVSQSVKNITLGMS